MIDNITPKERVLIERVRELKEYEKIEIRYTRERLICIITKNEKISLDNAIE